MPDITILGEAMVELSPTAQPGLMQLGFAGDTFNTAWYLAQLWRDTGQVRYATMVGRDETSAAFRRFAAEAGIKTELIGLHKNRGMGLYMIHLESGERSFSYWRDRSAAKTLADDPGFLDAALEDAKNVYLSGITVAILPQEGRDRLARALACVRNSGTRVLYDTNLRPKLWDSAAEMQRETDRFAGCADVLLPSFDDEAAHFGHSCPEETACHYEALGAKIVVVKDAANPVLIKCDGQTQMVKQRPIDSPIDTTAAGDSFNAGFIARYLASGDLSDAVRCASSLAGQVILGKGALVTSALKNYQSRSFG